MSDLEERNRELEQQLANLRLEAEAERKEFEAKFKAAEEELKAERNARQASEEDLEAERKARQVSEENLEAERRDAQEKLEAERKEADSLRKGTYYSTVEQVWEIESVRFYETDFTRLIREAAPDFIPRRPPPARGSRRSGGASNDSDAERAVYTLTRQRAMDDTFVPAEEGRSQSSRGTVSPEDKLAIWPKDIFGNSPSRNTEIAHLVPASYNLSTLYRDVAICALGLEENAGWDATQKAIHGAKHRAVVVASEAPANERADAASLLSSAGGASSSTTSSRRLNRTGIKHFVPNKIRLAGQGKYLDSSPGVLIIPVMDMDAMKNWKGGLYNAIVLPGPVDEVNNVGDVCLGIGMLHKGDVANADQIEQARILLSCVIKGMAYSLKHRFPTCFERMLNVEQLRRLGEVRHNIENVLGQGVIVPKRRPETLEEPLRVRIVAFASAADSSKTHPAPDPFLLAVRAAMNWSWRNKQRLMAAAEPEDLDAVEDDDDEDELHRLAEEEFLAWREEVQEERELRARNISWEELARRLGQPEGYKGDDDDVDNAGGGISPAANSPATTAASSPDTPRLLRPCGSSIKPESGRPDSPDGRGANRAAPSPENERNESSGD